MSCQCYCSDFYILFNYVMGPSAIEFAIMDDPWNLALSHLMEWKFQL